MGSRVVDVVGATLGLVISIPLFVLIASAVVVDTGFTVFYRGRRVGRGAVPFDMLKFRTMIPEPVRPNRLSAKGDRRVTRVGRILRRAKLDELPQLVNVLTGEMSLVGPRPEDPRFVRFYDDVQRQLLRMRPGITSPASLAFRKEEELLEGDEPQRAYVETILPKKLAIDLAYFARRTLWSDLGILLKTVWAMRL